MGLNSEPLPENDDLLRMIDAGIAALRGEEQSQMELNVDTLLKNKENGLL